MNSPRPTAKSDWVDRLIRGIRYTLAPVASLKITVVLFALSLLLVFFGTVAQKSEGIWTVVQDYFYSYVVKVKVQHLFEFTKIFFQFPMKSKSEMWFPFPGGFLIGILMFCNLCFAHILQFVNLVAGVRKEVGRRSPWKSLALLIAKRTGIYILHAGVILLLVGEWVTREFQIEQQMTIAEGTSSNYAFDTRDHELAFVESAGDQDKVTVIKASRLRAALGKGETISHPDLPVDIRVLQYFRNSDLDEVGSLNPNPKAPETNPSAVGLGSRYLAWNEPQVSGVDMSSKVDIPSGYIALFDKQTGRELGTYLITAMLTTTQPLDANGVKLQFALRNTRYYKPYRLELINFKFERYIGTSTAKNYSSRVILKDPERGQDRETTISMNEPLRHRGETYYQSSFTPDEKTTILQVVRNPLWQLPYVSCALVTIGMLVHFGIYLVQFLLRMLSGRLGDRTRAEPGVPTPQVPVALAAGERPLDIAGGRLTVVEWLLIPVGALIFASFYLLAGVASSTTTKSGRLDLAELARVPVVDGGRVKPLDTVARVDLRMLTHSEEYAGANGKKQSAMKWFMDTATAPERGQGEAWISGPHENTLFRIENDEVLKLLALKPREGLRYSIKEMQPKFEEFDKAAKAAVQRQKANQELDLFELKVLELRKHIELYLEVWQGQAPRALPPRPDSPNKVEQEWRSPAAAREAAFEGSRTRVRDEIRRRGLPDNMEQMSKEEKNEVLTIFTDVMAEETKKDEAGDAWERVLKAYRTDDPALFDKAVKDLKTVSERDVPAGDRRRAQLETFLNETGLYYQCMVMYGLAGGLTLFGWLGLLIAPAFGNGIRRAVFWWLLVTLLVHTLNLLARMYLMDRPFVFVTNLHSSAVFIGWGVVMLCLFIELLYPLGIGNFIAAVLGFGTAFIAHQLAADSGDTLEMMQAVLDTNFWLATHVTTVTLGYAATYVAGFIGFIYVALLCVPEKWMLKRIIKIGDGPTARTMELGRLIGQFLYAVICFATLLSFVGTVLGGIWADQSWGRFWGWDPKENGAVLIVIWNALILHARWSGLVKDRGIAVLALGGNMITTWSWFGTNQLGVGLHAYGFSNKLAVGCMVTWVIHAILIAYGCLPWKFIHSSFRTAPTATPETIPTRAKRARRVD